MSVSARAAGSSAWTSELVIVSLEDAMMTLKALPSRGYSTRMSSLRIELPADDCLPDCSSRGSSDGRLRLPTPSPAAISKMDATLKWFSLIPEDRRALRKIVGLRSQTTFATGRPMAWKAVARAVNADPAAVKTWHSTAIQILVRALDARRIPAPHPDR